jgi:hypothetical protein
MNRGHRCLLAPCTVPAGLALLLIIAACTSADVLRVDPTPHPARPADSVEVLFQRPSRTFRVIGYVAAANKTVFGVGAQKLMNRLRKEAGKLGGDAIVFLGAETRLEGANVWANPYGATVNAKRVTQYNAAVIVWSY